MPLADSFINTLIWLPMQRNNFSTTIAAVPKVISAGKPSLPMTVRQPLLEKKTSDPSSFLPKGERYPIPAFFEYRIKAREHDPL